MSARSRRLVTSFPKRPTSASTCREIEVRGGTVEHAIANCGSSLELSRAMARGPDGLDGNRGRSLADLTPRPPLRDRRRSVADGSNMPRTTRPPRARAVLSSRQETESARRDTAGADPATAISRGDIEGGRDHIIGTRAISTSAFSPEPDRPTSDESYRRRCHEPPSVLVEALPVVGRGRAANELRMLATVEWKRSRLAITRARARRPVQTVSKRAGRRGRRGRPGRPSRRRRACRAPDAHPGLLLETHRAPRRPR